MFLTPLGSGSFRFGYELTQRYGTTGAAMIIGGAALLLWLLARALRNPRTPRQERRENPADKDGPPRFNG
jgi:hypothetical protein